MNFFAVLYFLNSIVNFTMGFTAWKKTYNISYSNQKEEQEHKKAFEANAKFISLVNRNKKLEYELCLNSFADLSFNEFKNKHLSVSLPNSSERGNKITMMSSNRILSRVNQVFGGRVANYTLATVPDSIDYRKYSLPVKSQMTCNACWAFATTDILESRMMLLDSSYNTMLSQQYFIDCDLTNIGCVGGWPYTALNWLLLFGDNAVPTLADYPYIDSFGICETTPKIPMNIIATVQNNTDGNETILKQIVANVGPVAVVIDATSFFQLYSHGIFYDETCNSDCKSVNHAVVIVGYGTTSITKTDYWIVKNSWSTLWGQQGYVYMSRNQDNQCNIACWAMYAI